MCTCRLHAIQPAQSMPYHRPCREGVVLQEAETSQAGALPAGGGPLEVALAGAGAVLQMCLVLLACLHSTDHLICGRVSW